MDPVFATAYFFSLRFSCPDMESRFTVEGPVHFGPCDDSASAKETLVCVIDAVHGMPEIEVRGVPRFTRGRYEVATDWVEPLRVIDFRRGIVTMTTHEVADLRQRMRVIIPVANEEWRNHLPLIPRYLMERVVRRYGDLYGICGRD